MSLVKEIYNKNYAKVNEMVSEIINNHLEKKIVEMKKIISIKDNYIDDDDMVEQFKVVLDEGRFKIVRARVRAGKVLRRHKTATRKGYTMRGGKVTKMSPRETLNRKRSQRKAKHKRKAKRAQSRLATKRAMRKRRALGMR